MGTTLSPTALGSASRFVSRGASKSVDFPCPIPAVVLPVESLLDEVGLPVPEAVIAEVLWG